MGLAAGAVGDLLFGAGHGFFEAIGLALEHDDPTSVDQSVDEGDDAGGVGEDLVPFFEGAVGGDDGALGLIATGDHLEQEVSKAAGVGQIPDLVNLC